FHSSKFPLRDAAGRAFVGSITLDVTEQAQSSDELRLQREQLRLVTDTTSAGMVRVSDELKYVWVNRVFAGWAGATPEELVGRPIGQLIGREDLAAGRPYIDRVLAGENVQYERLVRFKGLPGRWMRNVLAPAQGGERWISVAIDIHERKTMEETLREADKRKD